MTQPITRPDLLQLQQYIEVIQQNYSMFDDLTPLNTAIKGLLTLKPGTFLNMNDSSFPARSKSR